jgi:hypothetical protein
MDDGPPSSLRGFMSDVATLGERDSGQDVLDSAVRPPDEKPDAAVVAAGTSGSAGEGGAGRAGVDAGSAGAEAADAGMPEDAGTPAFTPTYDLFPGLWTGEVNMNIPCDLVITDASQLDCASQCGVATIEIMPDFTSVGWMAAWDGVVLVQMKTEYTTSLEPIAVERRLWLTDETSMLIREHWPRLQLADVEVCWGYRLTR